MLQGLLRYEHLESNEEDGALEGDTSSKFRRRYARLSKGIKRFRRLVSPLEETKKHSSGGPRTFWRRFNPLESRKLTVTEGF